MSDLRTEIVNKVLNQWENVAMHTANKPVVTNVKTFGEKIFDYVTTHPYSSVDEIERGLGVGKEASVSSYLKAQIDKGLLGREEKIRMPYPGHGSRHYFAYYHISDTYNIPKKPRKARSPNKAKVTQAKRIEQDILAPLNERLRPMPRMKQAFNAEEFVGGLSLKEAKEVFDTLKGYFGG